MEVRTILFKIREVQCVLLLKLYLTRRFKTSSLFRKEEKGLTLNQFSNLMGYGNLQGNIYRFLRELIDNKILEQYENGVEERYTRYVINKDLLAKEIKRFKIYQDFEIFIEDEKTLVLG